MDDTTLIVLRDAAVQLIRNCNDEDLLDLICKLLIESNDVTPQRTRVDPQADI